MELQGKTALVTGGGTGIGKATALRLAKENMNIAINYSRSEEEALKTKKEVEALGVKCLVYKADIASDAQIKEMISGVVRDFGRLDVLVNNAGRTKFVPHPDLEGMKDEFWDDIFAVNVKGMFFACRAAAEELRKTNGVIVNITSIAGLTGLGSSIAYSASKAAAISVTKSLARVLAPEVRVMSIAPGIVMTRWVDGQDKHIAHLAGNTPMKRIAVPEDVAELVYGVIAHAGFVTGQTIVVDGGAFI